MVFQSKSKKDTGYLAKQLAKKLSATGGIIALIGELGAGKTTFAQAFAKALGINEKVTSPTFILMRQYQIPKQIRDNNKAATFYHLDLYRLENINEIKQVGLDEIVDNLQNIILIEWAEKILDLLPKNTLKIYFKKLGGRKRELSVT